MATLFIADLHLCPEDSTITDNFLYFLRSEAKYADALYILGDLFETWIGDDNPDFLCHRIAKGISILVKFGVPCYFIHGNRDFLLGKYYANKSGMTLLPDEQVLNVYKHKILIMHGDTLCTNDKVYQIFRTMVHMAGVQRFFLTMPLSIRSYIFAKIRSISKNCNSKNQLSSITTVNQQSVMQVMKKYKVQLLIHGHIHYPDTYNLVINKIPAQRIVLGAWKNEGSVVRVTPDNVELISFPF